MKVQTEKKTQVKRLRDQQIVLSLRQAATDLVQERMEGAGAGERGMDGKSGWICSLKGRDPRGKKARGDARLWRSHVTSRRFQLKPQSLSPAFFVMKRVGDRDRRSRPQRRPNSHPCWPHHHRAVHQLREQDRICFVQLQDAGTLLAAKKEHTWAWDSIVNE